MFNQSEIIDDSNVTSDIANPSKFDFLDSLDLDSDVKRRLSIHLNFMIKGGTEVYLTPMGKDHFPDDILDSWNKIYESNIHKLVPDLISFDYSNRSKFGPRSISKPWSERKSSMFEYFKTPTSKISEQELTQRIPNKHGNLRPISTENGMKYLKNSTNSGLPFYTKKSKVKDIALSDYDIILKKEYPCILFTRTQEQDKTRNVWGYPICDTLREMLIYRPLLTHQSKLNWRSVLLGPDYVDKEVSRIFLNALENDLKLYSVDFSTYDATVGDILQKSSFRYIKMLFQPQYNDLINEISTRFGNIPILTPSGVIRGFHGVPSGSTLTNELDSIAQYLISKDIIDDSRIQVQGDDGLYATTDHEKELLSKRFISCGLILNDDKSYYSKDYCVYLQRMYHKEYLKNGFIGGIYSVYRAVNRLVFQERYANFEEYGLSGKDYYSLRAISILENCKYHPLFKELVAFVFSKDKYLMDFSEESVINYNKMVNQGSGTGGVINNQLGDNISGIKSFDTVKVINGLR